jgi:hypothetical protein
VFLKPSGTADPLHIHSDCTDWLHRLKAQFFRHVFYSNVEVKECDGKKLKICSSGWATIREVKHVHFALLWCGQRMIWEPLCSAKHSKFLHLPLQGLHTPDPTLFLGVACARSHTVWWYTVRVTNWLDFSRTLLTLSCVPRFRLVHARNVTAFFFFVQWFRALRQVRRPRYVARVLFNNVLVTALFIHCQMR